MSTDAPVIKVSGIEVDVVRKKIKNLHVGVYPPFGRVRVAAPPALGDDAIRLAVASRLPWIKSQQQAMRAQERQSEREMVDGEAHYVWGRKYRLQVVEATGKQGAEIAGKSKLVLRVRPGSDREARIRVLNRWYREELSREIPPLISDWAPRLNVEEPTWRVRRMKTKWGTCNPDSKRITINLEMAKKPPACLEYIVVHEMVHLLERTHSTRFFELQDRFLPSWRGRRELLNTLPLGLEEWGN